MADTGTDATSTLVDFDTYPRAAREAPRQRRRSVVSGGLLLGAGLALGVLLGSSAGRPAAA